MSRIAFFCLAIAWGTALYGQGTNNGRFAGSDPFQPHEVSPHGPHDIHHEDFDYSSSPRQRLRFFEAESQVPAPLVIYLSSDPWSNASWNRGDQYLAPFFVERGYAEVDIWIINRADRHVDTALPTLISAIVHLRDNAERYKIDPNRIILAGRGSAASVMALIATDPSYFEAAGLDFSAIRGVIIINGDGLDLEYRAGMNPQSRNHFSDFFGEENEWPRFSAARHLAPPNAPDFFMVADEHRGDFIDMAQQFGRQLQSAGIAHEIHVLPRRVLLGSPERRSNRNVEATEALEAFMARNLSATN